MMASTSSNNDVTAALDQDEKEVHSQHSIDALLQKLREKDNLLAESEARNEALLSERDKKDAVIAEKDALLAERDASHVEKGEQLSVALVNNNTDHNHSLSHIPEDRSAGDEVPNHFGSVSTFADYLQSRRSSTAHQRHNSVVSDLTPATNATVRTAEEMRVIRRIDRRAAKEWDHLSYGAAEAEGGTVSGEDHGNGSRTPWYNPPIQRQRWCEDQSLPHVNWGDIFFDLFYVGAAFNLGVLIMNTAHEQGEQLLRGFLYFFGSLGPLWTCWEVQTFYESRFVTNDYFHRILDIVRYFCVGIAIYNIAPLHLYSDPMSSNALEFTLAMLVELMIAMGLCLELYFKGLGDRVSIKNFTLDDFKFRNAPLLVFYLAAFIIAAVNYAQARKEGLGDHLIAVNEYGTEYLVSDASDAHHDSVEAGHDTADSHAVEEAHHEAAAATGDHGAGSGGHRLLGGSSSSREEVYFVGRGIWDIYDLPMTLTTVAYFLRFFMTSMRFFLRDMKGDIRSWYIPTNIDYLIHRYGEFVMLMIGEGVLSLLVIETVETKDYFVAFVCGLLTMIFIHVLKTESDPHDSSKHALSSSRFSALWYSVFVQTLTIGLIGFGVSYKSFLHDIFDHAILTGHDWEADETIPDYYFVVAKAFSAFLTIVILSLELMNATHRDIKESFGLFFQGSDEGSKRLNWPVVIVNLLKVGVILFCATLFVWLTLPDDLAIAGLCVVFALSVTRVLNHIFIHEKEMVEEVTDRAVNVAGGLVREATKRFMHDEEEDANEQ